MKCPKCEIETKFNIVTETLVGYGQFLDNTGTPHQHNDNCLKREYTCINGHEWDESIIRTCNVSGCNWTGKTECGCHKGKKVQCWTDPDDYHLTKEEYYRLIHKFGRLLGGQYYDSKTNTVVDLNNT